MSDEKAPTEIQQAQDAAACDSDPKIDRRTVGKRLGRFLVYTAPALLTLATAKDAGAY